LLTTPSRPIGYGLFLRATGWGETLWLAVLAQSLIVNLLVRSTLRLMLPKLALNLTHFCTVLLLTLVSSLGWYAGQVMPDIFTSVLLLALFVFLHAQKLTRVSQALLIAVIFLCIIAHHSHLAITLLLLVTAWWWGKSWHLFPGPARPTKRLALVAGTLVAAFLFGMWANHWSGRGFRYSPASNVFITANLGEMGLLRPYLLENCPERGLSLCQQLDSLPRGTAGFLWSPSAPFKRAGMDWAEANAEYSVIVRDFTTRPRYLFPYLWAGSKATAQQLFQVDIGSGLYAFREQTPPYYAVQRFLPGEMNNYLNSEQNEGHWNFDWFNRMNYLVLALSLMVIAFGLRDRDFRNRLLPLVVFIGFGLVYNAAVTAVLANVYERLQARLTWLVVFVALVYLWKVLASRLHLEDAAQ
ncbi:MAG: hypothetical protein AAGB22_09595, partial [Bacteroidota bacterium]